MIETQVTPPAPAPATRLAVLLFTDIVGSTELKSKLGGTTYTRLLSRHNELFEAGIRECAGGEIIKHTGDGYFASFPTASDAVRFALRFQSRIGLEPWDPRPLRTRAGIHIGEVALLDMAGRKDVVGLSADVTARIMSLASGGQILLTAQAFNDARQFVSRAPEGFTPGPPLRWIAHGPYVFKGSDDPLEVFEVGIEGFSPLSRPTDSEKVKRVVPHDQEPTLGWRRAVSLEIPGRPGWQLERKLGDGGFGEVWLGTHEKLKQRRVFKFCFDAERLRSFKREMTFFRLLREALGQREDIATLYEVKLDEPPFFLESEYTQGGNLLEWAQRKGGIDKIPLNERLDFAAKVADAVAAAHTVGVLHKDIKPSNILIAEKSDGTFAPVLSDFGIGILSDRSRLSAHAITETGFTQISQNDSSRTGTRMYSPPESLLKRPFSTQGDVYALGVLTYQMAVGDLQRPLAPGWERGVHDELLREDIATMVEGDPQRRMATAADVAQRLRSLDARREQRTREQQRLHVLARRKRRNKLLVSGVALLILVLLSGVIGTSVQASRARRGREAQRLLAESYASSAQMARRRGDFNGAIANYRKAIDAGYPQPAAMRVGIIDVLMSISDYKQARADLDALKASHFDTSRQAAKLKLVEGEVLLCESSPGLGQLLIGGSAPSPREQQGVKLIREAMAQGLEGADEAMAHADLAETFPELRQWLERVVELDPYNANANSMLGAVELLLGYHEESSGHFRVAALLSPDDPLPVLAIAFAHAVRDDPDAMSRALEPLERRLGASSVSGYREFFTFVANLIRDRRSGEQQSNVVSQMALLSLVSRVSGDPSAGGAMLPRLGSSPAFRNVMATAMTVLRTGMFHQRDAMLAAVQRLVEICPNADTTALLAASFYDLQRYPEAEKHLTRALEMPALLDNHMEWLYGLTIMQLQAARPLAKKGDLSGMHRAAATLRRAMAQGFVPRELGAETMVDVADQTGDLDLARELLARELPRYPDDRELAKWRYRLAAEAGNYGGTILATDEFLTRWPGDSDALKHREFALKHLGEIGPPDRLLSRAEYERIRPATPPAPK